ncbi:MAG TPA: ADP-dependent glucokinase/phosphofructokinase [Fibrobacteraceae bacterium]|nr:ADP-dependent glucokinase/phosphofructokinase [Fibrobacteraceae bacterium]
MNTQNLPLIWKSLYQVAPAQLAKMSEVRGVVSAFNANIDAVIKVKPDLLQRWISLAGVEASSLLLDGIRAIQSPVDVLRGFVQCFKNGTAMEWLVQEESAFQWMREHVGYDRLQMGGQGGIIANVLAVCGAKQVFVHCASLPEQQAKLFLDLPNLLSAQPDAQAAPAAKIHREKDLPLIHWILEFDKGDVLELAGQSFTCPKSNRFIATWDPENFRLAIDPAFDLLIQKSSGVETVLLAGYQMLSHPLLDGTSGTDRVDASMRIVGTWRKAHPGLCVHFEFASTQDKTIRKYLLDHVAPWADSIGLNEQELIDVLDVAGETEMAAKLRADLHGASLLHALEWLYRRVQAKRIQLHFFGMYLTLQAKNHPTAPATTRNGMILAATIAAAKAGTGSIEKHENLMWAHGRAVSDVSLQELQAIAGELGAAGKTLLDTGIASMKDVDVIAVPTILIEKPITLVGMGDTISSLSLIGAK